MAKKSVKKPVCKISLVMGDKTIKSSGETVLDALRALPKPIKIMHKGVMTVKMGGKKGEMLFVPSRLKRLFYPQAQIFQAKYLELRLK